MELTLTEDERTLLQEVVSSSFRDLRFEIADTDNHEYRDALTARETLLQGILERLGGLLDEP
jgi:hypothetical protein